MGSHRSARLTAEVGVLSGANRPRASAAAPGNPDVSACNPGWVRGPAWGGWFLKVGANGGTGFRVVSLEISEVPV